MGFAMGSSVTDILVWQRPPKEATRRPLRWRKIILAYGARQMSDGSLPPSPPAEKAAASQDQAGQARADDRAWHNRYRASNGGEKTRHRRLCVVESNKGWSALEVLYL